MNKNNPLPPIIDFLDHIDPAKTIDRDQAQIQLGGVILGTATEKIKGRLDEKEGENLEKLLQDTIPEMSVNILNYFKKIGKFEEFSKLLDETAFEVQKDYLRYHLDSLDADKKRTALDKFPGLKNL